MTDKEPLKVVAYIRVSTSEQGNRAKADRLGMEAQRAAIERWCQFNGATLAAVYEEVISGKYWMEDRPKLQAAFKEADKIKGVVLTSKLDRLSRDLGFIHSLYNKRKNWGTAEDGVNTQDGRLNLYFKALMAEEERHKIGQRTKDALAVRKGQGKRLGGRQERLIQIDGSLRPAWEVARERAGQVVSEEADLFARKMERTLRRMRDAGMTTVEIAEELNRTETKTARGKEWYASSVTNILKRLAKLNGEDWKRFGRPQK